MPTHNIFDNRAENPLVYQPDPQLKTEDPKIDPS